MKFPSNYNLPCSIITIRFYLVHFAGNHSLGNHLNTLLRDAEQKVRELSSPQDLILQQQLQSGVAGQFNSRASFTNIIGEYATWRWRWVW